ncbi:hypothetical protein [Brevundimonas bullata]|uniref:hypothetical protein n=1 Tax=Brevundimonas bullata TaxID=13160 RepID=UPI002FDAF1FE
MSRRKTISDTDLLEKLMAALRAHGPSGLSFTRASAAAGLAAATLVQRFGTRDGMVEAILFYAWDRLDGETAAADAEASSGPSGAVSILLRLTNPDAVEYDFTDGLLLLREDIRNPVLRARGAAWGARLAEALGRRLCNEPGHAADLGWQMASLWQGTLVWQAFRRDADPAVKVREVLEDWLRRLGLL